MCKRGERERDDRLVRSTKCNRHPLLRVQTHAEKVCWMDSVCEVEILNDVCLNV